MERRTVVPRTMFEKKVANAITIIIALVIVVVVATFSTAFVVVLNRAEFGSGVQRAIWQSLTPFVYVLIAETIIGIIVGRRIGIVVSQRLAGPISRITAHLRKVVSGETKDGLSIRTGDEPIDLINLINQLISWRG